MPYVGNISVGSFLVPFSFELATSDRWMDFIERSAAFDAFVPATNFANYTLGAKAFSWNEDKTLTYPASAVAEQHVGRRFRLRRTATIRCSTAASPRCRTTTNRPTGDT